MGWACIALDQCSSLVLYWDISIGTSNEILIHTYTCSKQSIVMMLPCGHVLDALFGIVKQGMCGR
jgi:hypothetical protein